MRRTLPGLAALTLLLAAGCGGGGGGPITCAADDQLHTGEATYYTFADGTGNCGFDATPDDLMIGAMNHTDYAASAVCGACVLLTGPNASITIRIVDQCPECPAGNIDLSPEAFEQIAALEAGRVPISWQYVSCTVSGPIVFHWKDGSNQWWTAVQVRNHVNRVATFEYLDESGAWRDVPRVDYNYFVADWGMGPGPYTLRVTDVYGNALEDPGIPHVEAGDAPGSGQFPACD
jgi:expansin